MSWSFSCIGKPKAVAAALEKYGETLSGQSRLEFYEARSHLIALVEQNFVEDGQGYTEPVIDFDASGSGTTSGNIQTHRQCSVSIKPTWKTLVT